MFANIQQNQQISDKYPTNIQKISNKYPLLDQSLWAAAVERCAPTIIRIHFISDIYSFSLFKYLFLSLLIFQIRASTFQISIFLFSNIYFHFSNIPFSLLVKDQRLLVKYPIVVDGSEFRGRCSREMCSHKYRTLGLM